MFDWVQVRALAGPLKDIHRVVPKLLMHCPGCVLWVIVLFESDPHPSGGCNTHLGIHMERVIDCIHNKYTILDRKIPISMLLFCEG